PEEGRPALQDGAAVLAPVEVGAAWRRGAAPRVDGLPAGERAALAAHWLAMARAEHASIASFARAALELAAVGAPPGLLVGVARAMADEVRHAELGFALASAYAGREVDPGPMPALAPRGGGLAAVACDTFVEGCVAETDAVLRATRAQA